jgi:hypothetical protein
MERPTQEQIKNFVNFVLQDHSWGKHLQKEYKFYIMMVDGCSDIKPIDSWKDEEYINQRKQRYHERFGSLYYLCDYYLDSKEKIKTLYSDENTVKFICENAVEMDKKGYYSPVIYKEFLEYTQKIVDFFFPEQPEK